MLPVILFCACLQKESLSERVRTQDTRVQELEKQVEEVMCVCVCVHVRPCMHVGHVSVVCVGVYLIGMQLCRDLCVGM